MGAVSIEALTTGQRTPLASRQVPDVVDLVSGTMYSARVDDTSVPSASDVAVLVSGSADVPAFSGACAPRRPKLPPAVRVNGRLDASNLDVTSWGPGEGDAVYVDVGTLRCTFTDDGHAIIPSSADGDVTVHRVVRERLSIPGLDGGELRFDFARVVSFRR